MTTKRLTLIPTALPTGTSFEIHRDGDQVTFMYDLDQAPQLTDAEREADLRTLEALEATLGVAR